MLTNSQTHHQPPWIKSKSNEKKKDSNDCKAGPSKRFKKDDSSLIKDDQIASNSSEKAEVFPIMENCGNVSITYHGPANNIITHIVNNYNFTREPTNAIKDEPSIIVPKTVANEVFPNDKEIMKLVCEHLSFEDKTDCTLVCNRFNDIISEMNCFRLVVKSKRSKLQIIPTVSRHYKKLVIHGYNCKNLPPAMHKMLKHLSQSVTDLTLDCCEFDIIALSVFLCELPLLESLTLEGTLTIDSSSMISEELFPKLLHLKDFNINVNNDKFNEILDITGSASNIQSLTLFDAIFNENLIKYLTQNKNTLTSLSLTECIMDTSFMASLNSLHFGSSVKISSVNFKSFDCLNNLRKLELININNEVLGILKKKWVKQLEECTITFNYKQKNYVERYFNEGFFKHFNTQGNRNSELIKRSDDGVLYKKDCFRTDEKMIEFFAPILPNPSVDDINNNMCYFKSTPFTKNEDFLINGKNDSIIPSSLLQDILIANRIREESISRSIKNSKWFVDHYQQNKEYRKCGAEDDKWYEEKEDKDHSKKEYNKCYKRDDEWWQVCDDWNKENDEWCSGNQEWYREYYKCYKRIYEWWEVSQDWKKEYDDWIDWNYEWCEEYFNWYRDYHKYKDGYERWKYEDRKWVRDFNSWVIDYENYRERYMEWIKNDPVRIELSNLYNIYDKEFDEWCDEYDKFCEENGGWNEKNHEEPEEYQKRILSYLKKYIPMVDVGK